MNKSSGNQDDNQGTPAQRRSAARLAAVQALYEMEVAGSSADPVLKEFMARRWGVASEDGDEVLCEADNTLMIDIVRGVTARMDEIDESIAPALSNDWTVARLEVLLRAILRCGVFELVALKDVPPRVVISEYMDVAHAFFTQKEPSLVNGVLDKIARVVRESEMGARGGKGSGK